LIGTCIAGLLASVFFQSRIALRHSDPLFFLGIGAAIAFAVLLFVTAMNRARLHRLKPSDDGVNFLVRPVNAVVIGAVYLFAFVGVIAVAFMLKGETPIEFGSELTSLPIWAIGFAVYRTSYVNPKS
jgi:hypothetical protein